MSISYSVVFAYIFGIIFLFFVGRSLLMPMKIVMKFVYNALIGGLVLLILNYVGGMFQFHIAFNVITALITGFLGIPGIILLIILKFLFKV